MSKFDSIIDNKIFQNLFLWFCLYIIFITSVQSGNRFVFAFYIIALLAPAVYVNNIFVLPLFKKNNKLFFLLFFANAFVFSAIAVFLINYANNQDFDTKMFVNFFGIMILAVLFSSAVKIARDSFTRRHQEKEAELKLLKAQLNPHFLFNTLNNLYGLSVLKSDKLPNLMLKLSDLLRYSLYDTKEKFVSLEKEISYLENYISLEKIRLEETEILFHKTGNTSSKLIAPMLLIVFVENAFKHLGTDKKSKVLVDLFVDEDKLHFICTNTIDKTSLKNQHLEKGKSGIGLENAKKRLNLIYPNKHQLNIKKEARNYMVELTLIF